MIEHPQIFFGGVMLAIVALVAWLFWMLPLWSRPGIFFAVTVVPEFRSSLEAARLLRNYRIQTLLHVAIGFALILAGALLQHFVFLILGVLWLAVGPLIAVAGAHKKALPHAVAVSTIREASLSPRTTQLPGGWILQLGPFAILLVAAGYIQAHWRRIPDRFPVHWGIDGMPNGWSGRTLSGVYGPLFCGAALVIGFSLIAYGTSHLARRFPATGDAPGNGDFAHRVAILLLGVEYFLASIFALVALLPFTGNPGAVPIVILTVAILASAIFLRRWINHGRDALPHTSGDGTPDTCWKFGLFYFNADDSALFVEKRIGIGYTINFAHASAWVIMSLTLLASVGLAALAIRYH
jgi:uncharacterized membrane protein